MGSDELNESETGAFSKQGINIVFMPARQNEGVERPDLLGMYLLSGADEMFSATSLLENERYEVLFMYDENSIDLFLSGFTGRINESPVNEPPVIQLIQTPVGIRIGWHPSDNVHGYNIYRSTVRGQWGERINETPVYGDRFFDINVERNAIYFYTIVEINPDGTETPITNEQAEIIADEIEITIQGARGFILMEIESAIMLVNGEILEIDPGRETTPIIRNGRTLIPIRAVIEAMGGSAEWIALESRIDISAFENILSMWLGRTDIRVNGANNSMDIAPESINGRTMLPVRFVAENIGCQIEWIASTQEIVIVYPIR
jgi:hypothetical protein